MFSIHKKQWGITLDRLKCPNVSMNKVSAELIQHYCIAELIQHYCIGVIINTDRSFNCQYFIKKIGGNLPYTLLYSHLSIW